MYSGGVPTRHTQMGRPTYEAPTREYYTHKHTQTQTNTQRGPTKYGADSRRGGALLRTLYRPPRVASELLFNDGPEARADCTAASALPRLRLLSAVRVV